MKRLLFFLMLTSAAVFAQPRWMDDDDFGPPHERGRFIERLHLSDEQEEQFEQFRSDFQKKNIDLRAKVQTARITMRDLFDDDKPSQDKIESQLTEISKHQNEMKLNAVSFWFKVNKILKQEQQELWKEHREMMQERMGHRQGFGQGKGMRKGHGKGRYGHGMKFGCRGESCD